MKTKLINVAVAGVLAMTSGIALAEDDYTNTWYVMPTIGAMNADSDLEQSDSADVSYGVRLGKVLSEHWDIQLGLTHADADLDPQNRVGALQWNRDGEFKQTLIGVDALYMFSRDKFRPFLLAGLGAARNSIDTHNDWTGNNIDESNWSWMANVGAGFQYFFTDNWAMQADLRHVWSRADAPSVPRTEESAGPFVGSETVGNTYLNLGVIYNFGKPKKVAVVEPVPQEGLPDVAAYDDEALPEMMDPNEQVVVGPDKPAFEKITLAAEVLFAFDKDALRDEGKRILDVEVVEKMKAHPEVELVLITGHTDRIGDDKYNQGLSERRATQVKKYIASQGVEESRLKSIGKGEKEPVADCKGVRGKKLVECLQPNRRVVVEVEVQRAVER